MLGRHLDRVPVAQLTAITDPELLDLLKRFETHTRQLDDCGAEDWADLPQRMHFIVHLFRAFHDCRDLLESPFTPEQVNAIRAGVLPKGRL